MRVALKYKNGRLEEFNEEATKKITASMNYLKLLKYAAGGKKFNDATVKILDKEIIIKELESIEVFL